MVKGEHVLDTRSNDFYEVVEMTLFPGSEGHQAIAVTCEASGSDSLVATRLDMRVGLRIERNIDEREYNGQVATEQTVEAYVGENGQGEGAHLGVMINLQKTAVACRPGKVCRRTIRFTCAWLNASSPAVAEHSEVNVRWVVRAEFNASSSCADSRPSSITLEHAPLGP